MIFVAFVLNIGPEAGWFAYVPLSGPQYSAGKRTDIWAQMITFTEAGVAHRGDRAHRDGVQAACARHVAAANSAARLVAGRDLVHGDLRDAGGDARELVPHLGPARQHPVLQPGRRRRCAAVAAPVLVLRPPGGLHHLHSGARLRCREIIATFAARPAFGYLALVLSLVVTGLFRLRTVGASHVRHRAAAGGHEFLHRGESRHQHPDGCADLLLDCDARHRRRHAVHHAADVRRGVLLHLHHRRPHGGRCSPPCRSTRRCTTVTSSSRTFTTC